MEYDFLRPKQVAAALGVSRWTLAKIAAKDSTFPKWVTWSAGVRVMQRDELDRWVQRRRIESAMQR